MYYYSRSPVQSQEEMVKKEQKKMTRRKLAHTILFVDIALVVLVTLFYSEKIDLIKGKNVFQSTPYCPTENTTADKPTTSSHNH